MIEELADSADDQILIGKCIHFDCKSFDDQELNNQNLDHLDLTVHMYQEQRKTRLGKH